jgi:serine phosphatase RsbU (regulator of sigma subunit)
MTLFLSGSIAGQHTVWPLDQARLGIGRSSRNGIQIADATVSKDHAEITVDGSRVFLKDLGSRNGTRVNGREAKEPLPLQTGDRVEVGHVQLLVTAEHPTRPLALTEIAVVDSARRVLLDQALERRTQTSAGARTLVHLLAQAGQMLVLPRPLKETCDQILEIVAEAVPASRYVVLMRGAPGTDPVQVAARMREGATEKPILLSHAIMRAVLEDCSSVVTADAASDDRFKGQHSIVAQAVHSAMAVPLFDNENVLGLIYVDRQMLGGPFSQEQVELLTLLANMAAVKIKNARLLETEQASLQLTQQLETAARIQRSLLPQIPERVDGYEFEALLESCYAVGGDLFDFHRLPDGRIIIVIGDVSGKGLGASLLMSSFVSAARVLYEGARDMAELATRLSTAVLRNADPGRFVTGVVACLDPASGTLEYVNAGHPPPCIVSGGTLRELEATGVPFGILPDFAYTQASTTLEPGSMLAIFSDGIPEAQCGEAFFDEERLHAALLAAAPSGDLASARRAIVERVDAFLAGERRTDDLTLFLLRRAG